MAEVNNVGKGIVNAGTTLLSTALGGDNVGPESKPRAKGKKQGAQGTAQKGNFFSNALNFFTNPLGAIGGLLGGLLGGMSG
jgi:hypothetical protein